MVYRAVTLSDLKSKKIYCFGAGKAFDSFTRELIGYGLEKNIKAVVDNRADRFEYPVKRILDNNISIITLKEMLIDIEPEDCILITTAFYEEVLEQLEKIQMLDFIECFIYRLVKIEQHDRDRLEIAVPSNLSLYSELQIPKTIHYCWFGRKPIPVQYQKWMESWKHYCPDYEIIEWNEDNYDVHKSTYVSQAYEKGQWAFVSDYARIDIINEYGGVYLDTDVELRKNIDALLMNDGFCGYENCEYVNFGLGFGAKKGNLILKEIKEVYDNMEFICRNGDVNRIPCPIIQTEVMQKHGLQCEGDFQVINGMTIYPARMLCGMSSKSFRVERNTEYVYAIHHFEGSWITEEERDKKSNLIENMKKWSPSNDYSYL